ncbi:MAG: hypothetical protein LQ347_000195 [Umbilicaria vellea]|nr:MAG: hypothetical protein LQ347_000195 [Umbilicaria vellea]
MAPATSGSVFPRDTIAAHKLWRSQKALSKKGEVLVEAVARRQGNAKGFNEWLEVVLRKMSDCVEVPYSSLLASIACVTGSSQHTFLMRRFKVEWGDKTTLDEGDDRRLVRKSTSTGGDVNAGVLNRQDAKKAKFVWRQKFRISAGFEAQTE